MILLVIKNKGNNVILDKQYLKSKFKSNIIMNNGTANHTRKKVFTKKL